MDMIQISVSIEGQQGLTWPRWKRLVARAGFRATVSKGLPTAAN
jgi:hypothetical protein